MMVKNTLEKVVLLIILVGLSSSSFSKNKLQSIPTNNGLNIVFNGKLRCAAGYPFADGLTTNLTLNTNIDKSVWLLSLNETNSETRNGKEMIGFFFNDLPGFKQGVEIWRYKPWNSWTKPLKIENPGDLHDWDVQFFYWQYDDGLYGAAIPLSGNGYRTTLGSENGKFTCKAYTYTNNASAKNIPMMAISFGANPYELIEELYQVALKSMDKEENLRVKKTYPDAMEYIGWCTWNSSHLGQHLDEKHLLEGAATFTDNKFPLGWLLVDDGWFDHDGSCLNAYTPNKEKFPNGFKSLNSKLKSEHGLKHVGIWHAYDGYWNGINPNSEIGKKYESELFSWSQREMVQDANSKIISYHFIKPDSELLPAFYENWHKYFSEQGFTFVKVDNQLVSERMCVNNFPIYDLAEKMHQALYPSVFKYFDGGIINCMDMTNDAFYNFGKSAVARCVEDYFPEEDGGVGYELERGGAAAHVLMALYNSLYFSQMAYTDFDMFESHNTYGEYHAAARAISGGPVYVTDTPGKQNFEVLWPLINADGTIIRADQPAKLTEDCLFQLQDKKPLKAFSFAGKAGLLAAFNAADADLVTGTFSPSEIEGLKGNEFAVYEFFSKELSTLKLNDSKIIELDRMGCKYFNLVPIEKGVALIGLVNKYNAPATILKSSIGKHKFSAELNGSGTFKALLPVLPVSVSVDENKISDFTFDDGVLTVEIEGSENPVLEIKY